MGLPKQRAFLLVGALFVAVLALFVVFRPGDQASADVELGDPNAWVEHGLDGELLLINSVTGEVTARIDVAEPGEAFTAVPHGDGAVLFNSDTNSISLVSGSLLRITATIPVDLRDDASARAPRVYGSPDASQNVVIIDDDRVLSIDPQTRLESRLPLAEPLASVTQDLLGRVVALPADADKVLRLDDRGLGDLLELTDPVGETASQRSVVRAGGSNYVVDPARLSIAEVRQDGTFGLPFCTTSAASGALTGGSSDHDDPIILAYNATTSTLNVSVPGAGCTDINVDIEGANFGAPVASKGMAYLPNWGTGRIVVVDIRRERVVANLPFGSRGRAFELEVVGSTVWANEPQGPFAAVVDESGIMPVAKIETIVAGTTEIDEDGDGSSLTGGDVEGSGLLVIGDTGEQVIASQPGSDTNGSGPGTGTGPAENDLLGGIDPGDITQPEAIGITIDAPAVVDDDTDSELVPELTETLIANFSVSSGAAIEGEVLRFIDFSTGSPTSWSWDFGDGNGAQEPNVEKSWDTEGVYLTTLTVTNERGDESIQSTEITIVPETVLIAPTADFSFDRNTIEAGESVLFESRTVGEADLLEWNFGDGESSVGPAATHTYGIAGSYTVTLTASNPAGLTTASTTVTVLSGVDPPKAAIGALPTKIVNGQFITLRSVSLNEPTRLSWDFGDGTRGGGVSNQHAWDTPGNYRVRLTVENSEGTDSTFVDITVAKRVDPPVSNFTQSATEVLVGQSVTFSNLSLNEPTRLIWNFGDETTGRGEVVTKSWPTPGRYRVTLRATNDAGTNRSGVTITVVKPVDPPVASFNSSATIIGPNQQISFQDTSTNNPTSWSWSFGDSSVSSNPSTSHEWAEPGTYTVRLTVANEGGNATSERQIIVKEPPSANFLWEATGNSIKFTDTSRNDPKSWAWDFGDGTTSTSRSPTHVFPNGAFNVTLVVANEAGTSSPNTQRVVTVDPPVAKISCEADGPRLRCSGEGSENATGFTWSSPDAVNNSTPNQPTTVLTYADRGRFRVTLLVSNEAGVTDSVTIRGPRVSRGQPPRIDEVLVAATDGDLIRLEAVFDRDPTSWEWTVAGAVLVEGGNSATPLFRVPANGTYSGQVSATNEFGTDDDTFSFVAKPFTTTASFEWAIVEPGVVRFTNTSQALTNAEFEWRFAGEPEVLDGNPQGPVVRYPNTGGKFRVVLVVVDANGRDVVRESITVPPVEDPPEDDD